MRDPRADPHLTVRFALTLERESRADLPWGREAPEIRNLAVPSTYLVIGTASVPNESQSALDQTKGVQLAVQGCRNITRPIF